jgi:UDP-GlcNAc:undecaprenyl-phosphate/decaprenyl-phosphate GlcNAc-1-phosphate transferase
MDVIFSFFLLAFTSSVLFHVAAIRYFPLIGLLDFPERYGLKRARLPYPTGVISVVTFLCFFLFIEEWNRQNIGVFSAVLVLGLSSFFDDRGRLSPKLRIGIQALCALIVFGTGTRIYTLTNPLAFITGFDVLKLDTFVLPWSLLSDPSLVGALFTIVWLGLTTNALNWFDGIPGQVSTISFIGFLTIGFLSLSQRIEQPELALIAFILAGIALGGLLFDFPPSTVLLGDTGAMFYGFLLGVLTIYSGGKVATAFLVLGIPLIDFLLVISRRITKKESIFRSNTENEHLHHRLLKKQWKPQSVILLTASIGTAFGAAALFMTTIQKLLAAFALLGVTLLLSRYSREENGREL